MTPGGARADLMAALGTIPGATVHPRLPDRFTPPAIVLTPADPWLDTTADGLPWQAATFRFNVRVVAGIGTTEATQDRLDDTLADVLAAVYATTAEWSVETVSAPGTLVTDGGQQYAYADVTVSAPHLIG